MNKKSGSSLFLIEMITVVFFFILCASFCILMFVKANEMSQSAKDLNRAVNVSQSIAESIKAVGMDSVTDTQIYFDREWNPVTEEDATYQVIISSYGTQDQMKLFSVTVWKGEKEVYTLDFTDYEV